MIPTFILDPVTAAVRPFAAEHHTVRVFAEAVRSPLDLLPPTSKRERRRRARAGRRGRRGARRVPPVVPFAVQMRTLPATVAAPTLATYHRHRLTDGRQGAALYLPEGQDLTAEHCAAVAALMPHPRAP